MTTPTPNLDDLERIASAATPIDLDCLEQAVSDFAPMAVPITQNGVRWLVSEARE